MKHLFFPLVMALILTGSCEKEPAGPKEPKQLKLPAKSAEIISRSNSFGIDLFTETSSEEDDNLMLSPLSASTALTMLLNGCNNNTYKQIRDMLGYEGYSSGEINNVYQSLVTQLLNLDPEIDLALANAVWYRNDFQVHQTYLDTMGEVFSAHIEALDFSSPTALHAINGWAKENTRDKIQKVLNEISPDAVMFLMNALYFKGTWTYQFDKEQTVEAPFYLSGGDVIQVETMRGEFLTRFFSTPRCSAAELTYGRQNFSMVVIEPVCTLNDFLAEFDLAEWEDLVSGLSAITEPSEYEIWLPKFKFEYEKILNDQLNSLGMVDAFNPAIADLTGISYESIFVSFVKQNTFVDVTEEGTEAAAVTTIGIELTSEGPDPFIVDKPFIFAIRERTTNTILFIGKVIEPEY